MLKSLQRRLKRKNNMKKQSFIYGAGILAAASLVCKMLSAILKVPLDRFFLHEEGIAIYQSAYTIYNVFLAVCVTGIPIALSSMIAKSDEKKSLVLCKSTFTYVTIIMTACAVLLLLFSAPLARILSGGREPLAQPSLMLLALSLPAMGIISSRRGYFQGKSDMRPSAISQLTESLIKVVFGIGICALCVKHGIVYGASGAISGVMLGTIGAALVLELFYRKSEQGKAKASLNTAIEVLRLSVPFTLGAFAFTAIMLTDTLTVPKILASCGMDVQTRMKLMGYLTRANTIYNLPATIITAFTASAVPSVAYWLGKQNKEKISDNTKKIIKLVFLVAFPCMLGMIFFAPQILMLLYSSKSHWQLLSLCGVLVLLMPYIQTTTAVLQTFGSVWVPIVFSMIGVAIKCLLNFLLVKRLGIEGAVLSTIVAFLAVFAANTTLLCFRVNLKGIGKILLKLFLCSLISCTAARGLFSINVSSFRLLVFSIAVAAGLYCLGIVLTGCIKREEFFSKQ